MSGRVSRFELRWDLLLLFPVYLKSFLDPWVAFLGSPNRVAHHRPFLTGIFALLLSMRFASSLTRTHRPRTATLSLTVQPLAPINRYFEHQAEKGEEEDLLIDPSKVHPFDLCPRGTSSHQDILDLFVFIVEGAAICDSGS